MRRETLKIEVEYKVFLKGEKVRPTSRRARLKDDIYTVSCCAPPCRSYPEETTVFLYEAEGAYDATYLLPADDPCFTCHVCGNYKATGRVMFGICQICQPIDVALEDRDANHAQEG